MQHFFVGSFRSQPGVCKQIAIGVSEILAGPIRQWLSWVHELHKVAHTLAPSDAHHADLHGVPALLRRVVSLAVVDACGFKVEKYDFRFRGAHPLQDFVVRICALKKVSSRA